VVSYLTAESAEGAEATAATPLLGAAKNSER